MKKWVCKYDVLEKQDIRKSLIQWLDIFTSICIQKLDYTLVKVAALIIFGSLVIIFKVRSIFLWQANIGSNHETNHHTTFCFPETLWNLRNYRVILDTEFPDSVFPDSIFLDSEWSDPVFWHVNLKEENKLTRKVCWDQINGKEKIPLSRRENIFLQILVWKAFFLTI